jgi:enoyl-CoA hydratase / 3-hydroxyacyl-CoA dehydrogenase
MKNLSENTRGIIGVVGAGNMGSGIAQKYATEKFQVILLDLSQEALHKGKQRIEHTLSEGVSRQILSEIQSQEILKSLHFTSNINEIANADLIIEAIFENERLKMELFEKLDFLCHAKTIFATNTSSFYVSQLAKATQRSDRFIGLHYFYHPTKNKLVEVIKGTNTSNGVFQKAWDIQEQIGKIPIESKDTPGFIVNRFFVPWLNEAMRMVHEGVANIATVEAAAKKTFEIDMGPFELMNVTGVPITMHSANTLAQELGNFYAPCELIRSIVSSHAQWDLAGTVEPKKLDLASARLLSVVFSVATQMVRGEKVCTVEDCDLGARVGLRWKKGPFELMGALTPQFISTRQEKNIGYLTLNRPDALNALNETVIAELGDRFACLTQNPEVHGIVIEAKGKTFVSGADTHFFVEQIQKNNISRIVQFAQKAQNLFYQIDACKKPVVCAIDGLTLGGGLELALSCDYIVATTKSKFGFPETGIGIYPGLGGTQRTPRRIGIALTRWLILTGETISAETAQEIGLINEIVNQTELKNRATQLAMSQNTRPENTYSGQPPEKFREISQTFQAPLSDLLAVQKKLTFRAPIALKSADELIQNTATTTLVEGLETETAGLYMIFQTQDALVGLSSIGKNKPTFTGC